MPEICYRDYDAASLERQYNPRLSVQNPQEIFDRWTGWSKAFEARSNIRKSVPYGEAEKMRLDIYPAAQPDAPILLFIHGGYWRAMSKDFYSFSLDAIVESGAAVASADYTLCPEVTLDEITDQMRHACAWVWKNASAFNGDPTKLHVSGHSAGGHLTAAMMATNWPTFDPGLPVELVKSGVPISGVFDLEPLRFTSINNDVRLSQGDARRNSPLFDRPAHPMPMTALAGGAESDEFRRQSLEFCDAWRPSLSTATYTEVPDANHFTIIEGMTDRDNIVTRTILDHLDS